MVSQVESFNASSASAPKASLASSAAAVAISVAAANSARAHARLNIEASLQRKLVGLHRDLQPSQPAAGLCRDVDAVHARGAREQGPAARLGLECAAARRDGLD